MEREGPGIYSNEVVIQHHDRIVTSSDLGLSVTCEYNLANKTVANLVDLKLTGEITPSLYEESVVDSPNVLMRVADDQGMTRFLCHFKRNIYKLFENISTYT